ncbi:MAG: single-stranded-DNA-specific exonuclease RecJ [Cyanobacteriota bacterium]|jgi:single-stranded-DNA-specific exonuclease
MAVPQQRWKIAPLDPELTARISQETGLPPLLAQVLINRGVLNPQLAHIYRQPESQILPSPQQEFQDLETSAALLAQAISAGERIAICGDYDADGMTSTALLLRAFQRLGARAEYAIPSRMKDGYGINERIVREFAEEGIGLIVTVDNGIAAYGPIALAVELGLKVIVTDHHDLPEKLPPAQGILNPKLLSPQSPYRSLAGVGVAYILAVTVAQKLGKLEGLTEQLLELCTLGTIADLAQLTGVNRRWLRRGLRLLPQSQIPGVQALIQVAGLDQQQTALKPDDIGFKLGPRINAMGRIGDPQTVIELLTTEDLGAALERALICEAVNKQRQELCDQIEREAVILIEDTPIPWHQERVLVVVHPGWHHGVIGIVASRLVERYGAPVFIATTEDEGRWIRGSARSIDEFNVFEALVFCQDLFTKFGGHPAAGGFTLPAERLEEFKRRLGEFARRCLEPEHLKPLLKIDGEAQFQELTFDLLAQMETLQPWGMGNPAPVFWSRNIRIKEQQRVGKDRRHLRLTLANPADTVQFKAVAWRWGDYFPLPSPLDVAYQLEANTYRGETTLQLNLAGVRPPLQGGEFQFQGRRYRYSFNPQKEELRLQNDRGLVLSVQSGAEAGLLGADRQSAQRVNLTQSPYRELIRQAQALLGNS